MERQVGFNDCEAEQEREALPIVVEQAPLSGEALDQKFLEMGLTLDDLNKARMRWQRKEYTEAERQVILGEAPKQSSKRSLWWRFQTLSAKEIDSFFGVPCALFVLLPALLSCVFFQSFLPALLGMALYFIAAIILPVAFQTKNYQAKKKFFLLKDKLNKYRAFPDLNKKIEDEMVALVESDFEFVRDYEYLFEEIEESRGHEKVRTALSNRYKGMINEEESFEKLSDLFGKHSSLLNHKKEEVRELSQEVVAVLKRRMEFLGFPLPDMNVQKDIEEK